MLRLILFIFGICLGIASAIAALPLPGKTFFNRMSKLPRGIKSLIDNAIDLAISLIQLFSTLARDCSVKTGQLAVQTKEKFGQIKRDAEMQRLENESSDYKEKIEEQEKEIKI